jgi:histone deacetylase 1/2
MHDVPRDSVDQHLGFLKEDEAGKDDLDERLARKFHTAITIHAFTPIPSQEHFRYVYDFQATDTSTSSSEEDEFWDSEDESTSTRSTRLQKRKYNGSVNRRRVSILTNQYFDLPYDIPYQCGPALAGKNPRRRFFNTEARWDDRYREIIRAREGKDLPWPHLYRPQRPDDIQDDDDLAVSDEGDEGSEDLDMRVD